MRKLIYVLLPIIFVISTFFLVRKITARNNEMLTSTEEENIVSDTTPEIIEPIKTHLEFKHARDLYSLEYPADWNYGVIG